MSPKHIWFLSLILFLTACPATTPSTPTLTVTPSSLTILAGNAPSPFEALASNSSGEITWSLQGPGSLSKTSGPNTDYIPPASTASPQTATLSASLVEGNTTDQATITINPAQIANGNLRVDIFELPIGVSASVTVTGPNAFKQTLTNTRTLVELAPGDYKISANEVRENLNGIETLYNGKADCNLGITTITSSCNLEVKGNELTKATVSYKPVPGTGLLWIPNYTSRNIAAFDASQLASSNDEPPARVLSDTPSAQGVAFDKDGNLWVTNWDGNQIRKYDFSQPLTDPPTPSVIISGNLNPTALAFAEDGSLWVTNRGNATVVKYSPDQLSTSGSPIPAVTIIDDGSDNLRGPTGIAFDKDGHLWFSNLFSQSLYQFANPHTLSGTINSSPDIILSTTITGDATLADPSGLAFDKDGNLWVSNQGLSTLVKFTPDQLSTSGTPIPEVLIKAIGDSLAAPGGLAFDASGNLWVSNTSSTVVKFTAAQLTSSGNPTPSVILSGLKGIDLGFLAFNPPPANLPLE